jgi:hypothetical protein
MMGLGYDAEEEMIAECFKKDKEGKTKKMGKAIIPVVTLRHTFQIVDEEGRWNGKIDIELKVGEVGSERGGGEDCGMNVSVGWRGTSSFEDDCSGVGRGNDALSTQNYMSSSVVEKSVPSESLSPHISSDGEKRDDGMETMSRAEYLKKLYPATKPSTTGTSRGSTTSGSETSLLSGRGKKNSLVKGILQWNRENPDVEDIEAAAAAAEAEKQKRKVKGDEYGVMGRGKEKERDKMERWGDLGKEKKSVNIILHSVKGLVDEDDDGVGDIYFLFSHGSNRIESKRVKGSGEAIFEDGMKNYIIFEF